MFVLSMVVCEMWIEPKRSFCRAASAHMHGSQGTQRQRQQRRRIRSEKKPCNSIKTHISVCLSLSACVCVFVYPTTQNEIKINRCERLFVCTQKNAHYLHGLNCWCILCVRKYTIRMNLSSQRILLAQTYLDDMKLIALQNGIRSNKFAQEFFFFGF